MKSEINELEIKGRAAKAASRLLAHIATDVKNRALKNIADELLAKEAKILAANDADYKKAEASGLDADMKLFEAITTGKIMDTRIGQYLESLNDRFSVSDVTDMLGLLKVHLELSLRAKGLLLMRNAQLKPSQDEEISEMFAEIKQLKKSIGTTGQLAIQPYLQTSSRDLWQIYMLEE